MRIITGRFRGRKLETPRDSSTTRPIPDRVRTAVFNMLKGHCEGEAFLDVFAGTGCFGLEAISRGATECLFVEKNKQIAALLRRNIDTLGAAAEAIVLQGDALGLAVEARCPKPVHVINFDPPYPMMNDPVQRRQILDQFVRLAALLDDDGFAIIRTPWPFYEPRQDDDPQGQRQVVDLSLDGLDGPETHVYGSTAVHWYAKARQSAASSDDADAG